jgi:hypothetical protein
MPPFYPARLVFASGAGGSSRAQKQNLFLAFHCRTLMKATGAYGQRTEIACYLKLEEWINNREWFLLSGRKVFSRLFRSAPPKQILS